MKITENEVEELALDILKEQGYKILNGLDLQEQFYKKRDIKKHKDVE